MTAPRDPDRLIGAFLAEGMTELPEPSYADVRDRIERTRQRVVIGPWREPRMPVIARVSIAAAAVLVAVVLGINLLPRSASVAGPGPSPTPTASPSPIAQPPAYAWPGPLAAGTYTTDFAFQLPFALRFTVPDGWQARDINIVKNDRLSLALLDVDNLYVDACSGKLRDQFFDLGINVLADGLATMPGLDATSPSPVSLGGLSGKYLEYTPRSDVGCPLGTIRLMQLAELVCDAGCSGIGSRELGVEFAIPGARNRMWVLDAGAGGRIRAVVQAASVPDATQAELDELQAVIDSIRVVQTVPATPPPQAQPAG
jgi:hypothetical protein